MPSGIPQTQDLEDDPVVAAAFDDFEAKFNFVGLYDLLLKIDRRNNPQLYD
jgi:hypothetical protein